MEIINVYEMETCVEEGIEVSEDKKKSINTINILSLIR